MNSHLRSSRPSLASTRRRIVLGGVVLSLLAGCVAGETSSSTASKASGVATLTTHVTPQMRRAPLVGRVPADTSMSMLIELPAKDPAGLAAAVAAVSEPASASYRQYITPDEFGRRYGVSADDYQAVLDWAKAKNLAVSAHPNRLVVEVRGTSADLEAALHVHLDYHQRPDGTQFHMPDAEPTLDLAVPVAHVGNLEDYEVPGHADVGSGGSGSGGARQGTDFRHAYAPCTTLNGAGQRVGIFMMDGFSQTDISTYASTMGLAPTPAPVQITATASNPGTNPIGSAEGTIDVEMIESMAPGAQVVAFSGGTGEADTVLKNMTLDTATKTFSSSWFFAVDGTGENLIAELALQGQTFFQATGDDGSYTKDNGPQSTTSSREQAAVTLVGGTGLQMLDNGGAYGTETTWERSSGGILSNSGTGGPGLPIPAYQAGIATAANQASTTLRNVPDVSAEAANIALYYLNQLKAGYGGTSVATPLWAGFTALVNEQAASNNMVSVGFINPALYAIYNSSANASSFHDVSTGSCPSDLPADNGFSYSATAGYDLCTGLGSPSCGLINALTGVHASKTSPALAVLGSELHVTYIADDSSNQLLHLDSTDGVNAGIETAVGNHSSAGGPALTAFNGQLHMAYTANNSSGSLLHISSADGVTWGTETGVGGHASKAAPALAAFNGRLYMSYIADNSSNDLLFVSSADGVSWGTETTIAGHSSLGSPTLTVFNNRLYVAYIANNSSGDLLYVSTADGSTWSGEQAVPGHSTKAAPSLATFNGSLYLVYLANNATNDILYVSSSDGTSWGTERSAGGHASGARPSVASFDGALRLSYIANNANATLVRVSSTDGVSWGTETVW